MDQEAQIIWLEDPTGYPFVREGVYATTTRTRPLPRRIAGGSLIGYATHRADGPHTGTYLRRFWWRKPHDATVYATGAGPMEAVDPWSILAQTPSRPYTPQQEG